MCVHLRRVLWIDFAQIRSAVRAVVVVDLAVVEIVDGVSQTEAYACTGRSSVAPTGEIGVDQSIIGNPAPGSSNVLAADPDLGVSCVGTDVGHNWKKI